MGEKLPMPDLPNMSPIRCEKCGGSAALIASTLDGFSRGLHENWTYQCADCGHKMTREIER
jgi:hypothetical protein